MLPPNSIFNTNYWLDATCGTNNWGKIKIKDEIEFPYFIKKKAGFSFLIMPPFTPWFDFNIDFPQGIKEENKLSIEKEYYTELIQKLPHSDYIQLNLPPSVTNWQPFFWKGFEQSTFYTYLIDTNKPLEILFSEIGKQKNKVHKAEKLGYKLFEDTDFDTFYTNYKNTLKPNKGAIIYPKYVLQSIYKSVMKHNSGKIISIKNTEGETLASTLYVWDKQYLYYLISVRNISQLDNCAVSTIVWEGIKLAHEKQLTFNFEGSMIEPIEHFFRSFGAKQTPYFKLKKFNSELLRIGNSFLKKL